MGDGPNSSPSGAGVCSPGIAILKSWQGIVEFVLRVIALISSIILLICACYSAAVTGQFVNEGGEMLVRDTEAASGWLAFISFVTVILVSVLIVLRFLNCGCMLSNATIVHIVDLCVSVVIAVGTLCGEIALSVYLNRWVNDRRFIIYSTAAAAGFGFITILVFIVLIVWMTISLLMKWPNILRSN